MLTHVASSSLASVGVNAQMSAVVRSVAQCHEGRLIRRCPQHFEPRWFRAGFPGAVLRSKWLTGILKEYSVQIVTNAPVMQHHCACQVDYLGPFLLTELLLPALRRGRPSRVRACKTLASCRPAVKSNVTICGSTLCSLPSGRERCKRGE